MADKQPKPDLRIYLRFEESQSYGDGSRFAHTYGYPMILARGKYDSNHKLDLWNPDSYDVDADEPVRALAGMRSTSQISNCVGGSGNWYGFGVEYERGHDTDLRRAESMLRCLRKVDREMRKLAERFGYARDLPQYLTYFATALCGPRQMRPFLRRVTGEGYDQDYEGTGYRAMDANVMRLWVEDQTKAWRERCGIGQEA